MYLFCKHTVHYVLMCIYLLNKLYIVFLCIYLANRLLLNYTEAAIRSLMNCPLYVCYSHCIHQMLVVIIT